MNILFHISSSNVFGDLKKLITFFYVMYVEITWDIFLVCSKCLREDRRTGLLQLQRSPTHLCACAHYSLIVIKFIARWQQRLAIIPLQLLLNYNRLPRTQHSDERVSDNGRPAAVNSLRGWCNCFTWKSNLFTFRYSLLITRYLF